MSEQQFDSPLETERGVTIIGDGVVRKIAGQAAGEVSGVHMGSNASRTAGGLVGRASSSGSQSTTRGVSVEVGRIETAIDLTMAIDYGRSLPRLVEAVRQNVSNRVEGLTGLRVTELNVTISDFIFPEGDGGSRDSGSGGPSGAVEAAEPEELAPVEPVEPRSRERSRAGREVIIEGEPLAEDETAELRLDEEDRERRRSSGADATDETRDQTRGDEGSGSTRRRDRDRRRET